MCNNPKHTSLISEWNSLIDRLNDKGGEAFINNAVLLSKNDVDKLIRLCHPDKHNSSKSSTQATQFLLKLRNNLSK